MRWFAIAAFAAFALPANAQDHSAHDTHGNHQPAEEQEEKPADHSTMNHSSMDHSSMDHSTMDHSQHPAALDKSAPNAKAEDEVPARALEGSTHAADEIWGADAMAQSRADLHRSHGAGQLATVRIDRIEARLGGGSDAYLWDLEASYGGDLNKIWLKLEGEGEFGGEVEDAEFQALYSRAITPFFDLQLGARLNVGPETRSHLVVGLQGTAPYWLHVDAAAFLSDRGDLTARAEIEYDQKITQQLILQPRVEAEIAPISDSMKLNCDSSGAAWEPPSVFPRGPLHTYDGFLCIVFTRDGSHACPYARRFRGFAPVCHMKSSLNVAHRVVAYKMPRSLEYTY